MSLAMGDASIRARALAGLPMGVEVVDCHAHVGPSRGLDRDTSVEAMLGLMDAIPIARSAISGFMFGTGVRLETMNDWVAEFVRQEPDRFLGLCYLNPRYPEYLEPEMARCFDELGFAGFKLHIDWNGIPYDSDRYTPVYRFATARRLPVLAHTWGDDAVRRLAVAARAYPTVPFLAGHSGAGDVDITIEEARRTPNLFLELAYSAGTPWAVERFVREVGADRIVWGSDAILFAQSHQIAKVAFADISEWDKAAILGGNARRVFGL
jgi:predicted TIM-barrel fold metal-dependent hydrolase